MAKPREVRGWMVYSLGVGVAYLMLAARFLYPRGAGAPYLLLPLLDLPLLLGVAAAALAVAGLHQALWYYTVKPVGKVMYAASALMFGVGLLLFYALPGHAGQRDLLLAQFSAGLLLFLYVPTLSFDSRFFTVVGVAGSAALLAVSAYGPATGSASFLNPVILATLGLEALLVLTLLRLTQLTFHRARAAAA